MSKMFTFSNVTNSGYFILNHVSTYFNPADPNTTAKNIAHAFGIDTTKDPFAVVYDSVNSDPSAGLYVSWMRDPRHNLSLGAHAELWRRHGPRGLWPLSLALRVLVLLANYVRLRVLFPGEGRPA